MSTAFHRAVTSFPTARVEESCSATADRMIVRWRNRGVMHMGQMDGRTMTRSISKNKALRNRLIQTAAAASATLLASSSSPVWAQFSAGNLVAYRVGNGASALGTGSTVVT